MKHPVYWFLISSGLIASTSLSFAQADNQTLSSNDSFNGNTAGNNTFQTKETTSVNGTNYTCTGDVCIANANTQSKSCFSQTAGNLAFIGNGHSLCFENIDAGASNPGSINVGGSDKTLSVTGFSKFICSSCPPETTGQGAIKSSGTTTFNNDITILLQKNCSKEDGGAINCKGFTLTGTSVRADFIENKSLKNGGALEASGASTIENNSGNISFTGNTSAKHGGAIHSNSAITVSNNSKVIFSNNTTTGVSDSSGGAIYCKNGSGSTPELKLEGNSSLIFLENKSKVSGGAIYADKLTINSGGTTIFANNSVTNATPKGGAICIGDTNGECSLTANLGDIIFNGNTLFTSGGSSITSKRNAINLGTNGKFTKLSAKDGFVIYFYDPITSEGSQSQMLTINQTENTTNYTGKILFSGEMLSTEEKIKTENLTSIFKQPLTLNSGFLLLKEGVILEAKSFAQTEGSSVIMDIGTVLQTPNSGGETITLPNLSINIASLGGGGSPLLQLLKLNHKQLIKLLTSLL
ncbi:hypothetical protein [Chlamydia crocodili]|uniref:hypothetical protein n=1 Tax=Chlamydia crocodili TaxID=2766982 RepID=UPI0037DC0D1D